MALRYRDVRTRVVRTMLEPSEVIAQAMADGSDRSHAEWLATHQRKTIQKMDDAQRWERVPDAAQEQSVTAAVGVPVPTITPVTEAEPSASGEPQRPAINDPKAVWVDWAVSMHGYARDEAETLTKDQLRELE